MRLHATLQRVQTALAGPQAGRHGLMLFLLVALFLLIPVLSGTYGYLALEPVLYAIFLNGMSIAGISRTVTRYVLAALAVVWFIRLGGAIGGSDGIGSARLAYGPILLFITLVFVARGIITAKRVTMGIIYGAVSAYFLVALLWGFIFLGIETAWPGSFNVGSSSPNLALFSYFSFVTTTTLGYGDITPVREYPRMFAALEAFTGQVYVAVTIARLVALQISQSSDADTA